MLNLPVLFGAALIPTIVGFVWYNPKVFGNAWMAAAEMTEEKMKGANMIVIFGVSLLLSVMLAVATNFNVIHQAHIDSLFNGVTDQSALDYIANFHATYGDMHRGFSHGAIHGAIMALFFALPVLGTNALFERKGFKYIAVNVGYWLVTLVLMGGVICQFA
ncbi:DUF1761 domain-containing protein [Flavobacteriales bacterium]|nr:DUF1761 domain-containing protein [Flavobacteriales bacterium]